MHLNFYETKISLIEALNLCFIYNSICIVQYQIMIAPIERECNIASKCFLAMYYVAVSIQSSLINAHNRYSVCETHKMTLFVLLTLSLLEFHERSQSRLNAQWPIHLIACRNFCDRHCFNRMVCCREKRRKKKEENSQVILYQVSLKHRQTNTRQAVK